MASVTPTSTAPTNTFHVTGIATDDDPKMVSASTRWTLSGGLNAPRCHGAKARQSVLVLPKEVDCLSSVWYRYGDSNPGPVAENHVS
jgi:hypothetical protein